MSAYSEALALQESLPKTGRVSVVIGRVINALLGEAKEREPESISLASLEPLKMGETLVLGVDAENARAMVAVIAAALKPKTGGATVWSPDLR
jgi:hypothetical protein